MPDWQLDGRELKSTSSGGGKPSYSDNNVFSTILGNCVFRELTACNLADVITRTIGLPERCETVDAAQPYLTKTLNNGIQRQVVGIKKKEKGNRACPRGDQLLPQ